MSTHRERDIEHAAMNIVHQLGDELGLSVEKRQATNDKYTDFVVQVITIMMRRLEEPEHPDKDLRDYLIGLAETAAHKYAASLEIGHDRSRAFDVYENVRQARRA